MTAHSVLNVSALHPSGETQNYILCVKVNTEQSRLQDRSQTTHNDNIRRHLRMVHKLQKVGTLMETLQQVKKSEKTTKTVKALVKPTEKNTIVLKPSPSTTTKNNYIYREILPKTEKHLSGPKINKHHQYHCPSPRSSLQNQSRNCLYTKSHTSTHNTYTRGS